MKPTPSLCLVIALFTTSAPALQIFEPFADASGAGGGTYSPGANLIGQTTEQGRTWVAAGSGAVQSTIASGSLTIPGLSSAGNSARLVPGAGPSPRLPIGSSITSGSLYYSFAFQVTSLGSLQASGAFFAGFNNTAGASGSTPSTVGTRLYLRPATGGFNIGVNKASGAAADIAWGSAIYALNTPLFVVGSYDYGTFASLTDDSSRLWINPDPLDFGAGSAPAASLAASGGSDLNTAGLGIQSFLFMQRGAALLPAETFVDEIRLGTSWAEVTSVPEPSGALLMLVSLLGLAVRRQR